MCKKILLVAFLLIISFCEAQTPQTISYQGVARDSNGTVLASRTVQIKLSIHSVSENGIVVFSEKHLVTTSNLGLFNILIGNGTPVISFLSAVDWGNGAKFLQVELDPLGGDNFANMGTIQLNSVPYALYAGTSNSTIVKKAKIVFEVPSGGSAGTAIANAWSTRPLNSIRYDDIGISLSSNQIVLPAGTYEVSAYAVFNNANFKVSDAKLRIQNITTNATLAFSLNSSMSVGANYSSFPVSINSERFSLAATSNIALQYFINYAEFGIGTMNTGQKEVYAEVIITKN